MESEEYVYNGASVNLTSTASGQLEKLSITTKRLPAETSSRSAAMSFLVFARFSPNCYHVLFRLFLQPGCNRGDCAYLGNLLEFIPDQILKLFGSHADSE